MGKTELTLGLSRPACVSQSIKLPQKKKRRKYAEREKLHFIFLSMSTGMFHRLFALLRFFTNNFSFVMVSGFRTAFFQAYPVFLPI